MLIEIDVTNRGSQPLTNVKVTATPDPALRPVAVTELEPDLRPAPAAEGFHREPSGYSWTLARLSPGETQQLGMLCQCLQAAAQAYSRAQVTSQQGIEGGDQLWLPIRAAGTPGEPGLPGGVGVSALKLSVRATTEPIAEGRQVTYVVHVENPSTASVEEKDVRVSVEVPLAMTPLVFGTTGPTKPNVQGQKVTFEPLPRLAPGDSRDYRVRALAKTPGTVRVWTTVTSQSLREPKVEETVTTINPAAGG